MRAPVTVAMPQSPRSIADVTTVIAYIAHGGSDVNRKFRWICLLDLPVPVGWGLAVWYISHVFKFIGINHWVYVD